MPFFSPVPAAAPRRRAVAGVDPGRAGRGGEQVPRIMQPHEFQGFLKNASAALRTLSCLAMAASARPISSRRAAT